MSRERATHRPVFHATLAIVPSDPLSAYEAKGNGGLLKSYYNPLGAFPKVYCLSPLETEERTAHGMHVIPTPQAQLAERLRRLGVDVVRAYGGYWPCTFVGNCPDVSVPRIVSVHDTKPALLHDEVRQADAVFVMSRPVRSLVLERGVDPGRVHMLPNRVDLNVFRPVSEKPAAVDRLLQAGYRHVVLHVGRKSDEKNLDTVIRAMARLGDSYAALFVGPGDDAAYRALAAAEGIEHRCAFMGSTPNHELAAYYAAASCVCMPSRREGFGIVFIEALACGAVIVASDIAPLNEYMRHEHDALLVSRFEDPTAIADAIKRACEDGDLRSRLSAQAPSAARPFDRQAIDALEVGLYARILGAPRS